MKFYPVCLGLLILALSTASGLAGPPIVIDEIDAVQTGARNIAIINQGAGNHAIDLHQTGQDNSTISLQRGAINIVRLSQRGATNFAVVGQFGNDSSADVRQNLHTGKIKVQGDILDRSQIGDSYVLTYRSGSLNLLNVTTSAAAAGAYSNFGRGH